MSAMDSIKEFEADLAEVTKILAELLPKQLRHRELALEVEALQGECTKSMALVNNRVVGMEKLLLTLENEQDAKKEVVSKLTSDLSTAKVNVAGISKNLPRESSRLLSLIVGSVSVWKPNRSFGLKYKKEYEEYKKNFTWIIIIFSAIILASPNRIMESIFQFLLMFFYSTVTVREHILIVNGSKIRHWWMIHQYLAIGQSVLHFSWPDGKSYDRFRTQFFVFSLYLGLVQLIQYWYQSRSLYAKIAMSGSDKLMEITQALPDSTTLALVLLALTVAYLFQLYNAWTLGLIYLDGHPEWQVPVLALNFLLLGAGNIRTTLKVVQVKLRAYRDSRLKDSKSH